MMGIIYKYKDASGNDAYSDVMPATQAKIEVVENGRVIRTIEPYDHTKVKGYIKDTQKHVPKALVYVEYLEYLSTRDPGQMQQVMTQLRKTEPELWARLQRYTAFKSLNNEKMGNAALAAIVDLMQGKVSGGGVRWFETTLTEMMKRDGFIPPDVLGAKATTLPEKVPYYSRTRMGNYLKEFDAHTAKEAAKVSKSLSERPMLKAGTTAATRVGGTVLDVLVAGMDPSNIPGISGSAGWNKLKTELEAKGVIFEDGDEFRLRQYLASQQWQEARNLILEAAKKSGVIK